MAAIALHMWLQLQLNKYSVLSLSLYRSQSLEMCMYPHIVVYMSQMLSLDLHMFIPLHVLIPLSIPRLCRCLHICVLCLHLQVCVYIGWYPYLQLHRHGPG